MSVLATTAETSERSSRSSQSRIAVGLAGDGELPEKLHRRQLHVHPRRLRDHLREVPRRRAAVQGDEQNPLGPNEARRQGKEKRDEKPHRQRSKGTRLGR